MEVSKSTCTALCSEAVEVRGEPQVILFPKDIRAHDKIFSNVIPVQLLVV